MRRSFSLLLIAALMAAALTAVAPQAVSAQQGIQVVSEEPRNEFPVGVSFSLSFSSDADVDEVRLRYRLAPDGTGASAVAECADAATYTCTHLLRSGRGIFIIPGAEITYHWEIRDADGNTQTTPERLYVHEDTRFEFETVARDNVTVYYHAGGASKAEAVLDAAVGTLRDVGALLQTEITFPLKVFLYETAQEMQPAIASAGQDAGVQVLGEVVYSDTAMVSADVATLDITRHEVAHILTREATRGPFGVPGWMNEGISVYAQEEPLGSHDSAVRRAIESDRVLTMAELKSSSPGARGETVSLYYGQSGAIVRWLIETYGEEQFAELVRVFKEGSTPDKAFQRIYGFDEDGLEDHWREYVGLEPRAEPAPTEQARGETTREPEREDRAPGGVTSDRGASALAMGIIGGLSLAVLVTVGIATAVVRQRL